MNREPWVVGRISEFGEEGRALADELIMKVDDLIQSLLPEPRFSDNHPPSVTRTDGVHDCIGKGNKKGEVMATAKTKKPVKKTKGK